MSQLKLNNVSAMYPKIDKTYRFDQSENRSVPCDPLEDGAEYSLNFEVSEEQYKKIEEACTTAWEEFRKTETKAPAKPTYMPVKIAEDGRYIGKAKLKGAYSGQPTKKPIQVDAQNNKLPDDFQLTTGSIINAIVNVKPYKAGATNGVGLRLVGVQVVDLVEMASPFDKVEHGYVGSTPVSGETISDQWVENGGDAVPF